MKRNLLLIGAATLLLASCSTRPRYGCRGGRCIVESQKTTPAVKANS
ncbi:hypothetical protein [Flavobacterium akiainvivens]|nr:hypothetical protein [Flavobacterium akiainvivens]